MMTYLVASFIASLLFGQLPGLFYGNGVPIYVHDLLLVVLLAAAAFNLFFRRRLPKPKLFVPISAFAVVALLSLVFNLHLVSGTRLLTGFSYFARWLAYVLIYILVIGNIVPARRWLVGLYSVGIGFAVLGLIQFIFYPSLANLGYLGWDPYYYRLFSTLFDPNFAGAVLAVAFFLGLSFKRSGKNVIFELVIALALFLTFSRSSYLAFFAGLVIYGCLTKSWKLAVVFVTVAAIFLVTPKPGIEALRLNREISALARVNNWRSSFFLFTKSPVFGHGFNLLIKSSGGVIPSRAGAGIDNSWLFILDTTGVIGLAVFGWLTKAVFRLGQELLTKAKNRKFGVIFFSSLAIVLVHSLFNNSLFYPWIMIWLWILIGAAEVTARR